MTLQTRLNFGILGIAIVLVAPLVLSLRALQQLQADTEKLSGGEYAATLLLRRMSAAQEDLLSQTIYLSISSTDTAQKQFLSDLTKLARQTDTLAQLTQSATVGQIRSAISRLFEQVPRAYQFARANRPLRRDSIIDVVISPALNTVDRIIDLTGEQIQQRTADRVGDFSARTRDAAVLALGALGIAILIAFGVALWLTRSISAPLKELDAGMRAVAEGHLKRPLAISADRRDEFGRLAESFRSMAAQLEELDRLKA